MTNVKTIIDLPIVVATALHIYLIIKYSTRTQTHTAICSLVVTQIFLTYFKRKVRVAQQNSEETLLILIHHCHLVAKTHSAAG